MPQLADYRGEAYTQEFIQNCERIGKSDCEGIGIGAPKLCIYVA